MTVKTDVVSEYTSGSGVTIDGVLLKDGLVDGVDVGAPFAGLLATGATAGATSQAQAFVNGISTPTFVSIGTNPATVGMLRVPNAQGAIIARNATNNGDIGALYVDSGDQVRIAYAGALGAAIPTTLSVGAGRATAVNDPHVGLYVGGANSGVADIVTNGGEPNGTGAAIYPSIQMTANSTAHYGIKTQVFSFADGTPRTVTNQIGLYSGVGDKAANTTVTNAYGLYVEAPTAGGTINTGIYNAGTLVQVGAAQFTSVSIGTNPATVGMLRVPNAQGAIIARNATNNGDIGVLFVNNGNEVRLAYAGATGVNIPNIIGIGAGRVNVAPSDHVICFIGGADSGVPDFSTSPALPDAVGAAVYPSLKLVGATTTHYGIKAHVYSFADGTPRVLTNQMALNVANGTKDADTTITNAYGLYVEAQTVGAVQNIGIYNAGSLMQVGPATINQIGTAVALPALTLGQADVSEPLMKIVGESTTDNSQTLVDAANLTTPGAIVGWYKIYVEDVQGTNPITDGVYYVPFYATPTA